MSGAKQATGYILGNYATISNATSNSISYGSSKRRTSDQISVSLGAGSTVSGQIGNIRETIGAVNSSGLSKFTKVAGYMGIAQFGVSLADKNGVFELTLGDLATLGAGKHTNLTFVYQND